MNKSVLLLFSGVICSLAAFSQETLYVTTDRDIYSFGDEISFVAAVYPNDQAADCHEKLTMMLVDGYGNIASRQNFDIAGCRVSGKFVFSGLLSDGLYSLLAFTENMKQGDPHNAFKKDLVIRETKMPGLLIVAEPEKSSYLPDDEVVVKVLIYYSDGQLASRIPFTWEAQVNGVVFDDGKGRTKRDGFDEIELAFPDDYDPALVNIEFTAELFGNPFHNSVLVPSENLPMLVDFYPEGGLMIDEQDSKIGFTAFSVMGDPMTIKGELIDQYGEKVDTLSTSFPGYGIFDIKAMAARPLQLRITEPKGITKLFDLPKVQPFGVLLRQIGSTGSVLKFKTDITVDNTFLPVRAIATMNGAELINTRFYLSKEREISVPVDSEAAGVVLLVLRDENGEILAQTSAFVSPRDLKARLAPEITAQLDMLKNEYRLTLASDQPAATKAYCLAVVDQILSPSYGTKPGSEVYLSIGTMLAQSPFYRSFISNSGAPNVDAIDQFMITNPAGEIINNSKDSETKQDTANENLSYNEKLAVLYKKTDLDQLISIIQLEQFINDHFLRIGRSRPTFVADNRMALQAMDITPSKLSQDERVQRQLAQGKSILSVLMSIKPYRLVNSKIVFRGADSFNYQGGAVIVIDGVAKGSNISELNTVSPNDVASIKASSSISDVIKYTGMENSAGVVEIRTKKASNAPKEESDIKKYNPTLYWNPNFAFPKGGYSQLTIPQGSVKTTYRLRLAAQDVILKK